MTHLRLLRLSSLASSSASKFGGVSLAPWSAVALLAAMSGATSCSSTSTRVQRGVNVTAVEGIVRAQEAAWNRGDIRAFMSEGYWESPDLTFYSGGDVTQGFEPVLARYVKRYQSEGAEMGRLAFTDVEILPWSDDVAIARGRWALDFERRADVAGLFTLVFRRLSTGWRIVHDHTSVAQ